MQCGYPQGAGAVLVDRARRPGGRGRAAVRARSSGSAARTTRSRSASPPTTPSGPCSGRAASRPSPRSGGSAPTTSSRTASSRAPPCREVLRRIGELAEGSGVRVANVFHAGDGNLHPLVLFDDANARRGRAGRGGLGRDPRPLHRARRLDHRRARRRLRQGQVHAADVHRRRPRHHAAGPLRLRPATASPTPARSSRRRGCAARCRAGARAPTRCRRPGSRRRSDGRTAAMGHRRAGRRCSRCRRVDARRGGPRRRRRRRRRLVRRVADQYRRGRGRAAVRRPSRTSPSSRAAPARKLSWGAAAAPARPDRSTCIGMDRVIEHRPATSIVHVEAGPQLAALQKVLSPSGQRLAIDPVDRHADADHRGTVGGLIATGATGGPLRLASGGVRDLLIGSPSCAPTASSRTPAARSSRTSPATTSASCSAGSWGTLGVITEAVFRLHPVPPAQRLGHRARRADASHRRRPVVQAVRPLAGRALRAVEVDRRPDGSHRGRRAARGHRADGVDGRVASLAGPAGVPARAATRRPAGGGRAPWDGGRCRPAADARSSPGCPPLLDALDAAAPTSAADRLRPRVGRRAGCCTPRCPATTIRPRWPRPSTGLRRRGTSWGGDVVVLDAPRARARRASTCGGRRGDSTSCAV